ncbi:unnamed protein product [Bursaphelenchus okinawaensis]|uniref:DNA endonuclease activator Ctp1 C-terminal domain-containing protein n=1 Tax=Bursaphelenchus okinawaensis TaxID=465554 RepID=A0A811LPL4_9BILA|nr:unnamed protein product [Bursaphelenchus okinawaensis]CAG9125777.1 unnamed protein product [Bursaphelenchus okinawaensis]
MFNSRLIKTGIKTEEKENEKGLVNVDDFKPRTSVLCTPPKASVKRRINSPNSKWAEIQARLRSPSFKKKIEEETEQIMKVEVKYNAKDRESRCKMHAKDDCACCRPYYDALGLSEEETKKRIQQVGKHRALHHYDKTPPRYWDLEMRVFKSPKNSPSRTVVKKRRK